MGRRWAIAVLLGLLSIKGSAWLIPSPRKTNTLPIQLSLHEAILLALRNNPNVESAQLKRVLDKYDLLIAYHHYYPHFHLDNNTITLGNGKPEYSISPSMTLNTALGTQWSMGYHYDFQGRRGSATISITQPLLRGFGLAYNNIMLANALDQAKINRLNYQLSVRQVVDEVIQDYRTLVNSYNTLMINQQALKTQRTIYQQDVTLLRQGRIAASDLTQIQVQIESYQLNVIQAKNALSQAYKTLMTQLGLDASVVIRINHTMGIPQHYSPPKLSKAIDQALLKNIAYRQKALTLHATQRAVLSAQQDLLWQLNLMANKTLGRSGNTPIPLGTTLSFNLSIPIDNLEAKRHLASAKIDLINAQNALAFQKRTLISEVTQQIQSLHTDLISLDIAKKQVGLQKKTVKDTQLKLKYGKTQVFELTTQQNNLLSAEIALVNSKITLLEDIRKLHDLLGTTLDDWGVRLKY